jgi:hypothetical protein
MSDAGLPVEAVEAALRTRDGSQSMTDEGLIRDMLEAAAPRIIAVERERIAQLAEQEAAHADLQVASDEARIVGAVLRKFATRLRQEVTDLAVAERTLGRLPEPGDFEPEDSSEESGR